MERILSNNKYECDEYRSYHAFWNVFGFDFQNKILQSKPDVFQGNILKPIKGYKVGMPVYANTRPIFKIHYNIPCSQTERVKSSLQQLQIWI